MKVSIIVPCYNDGPYLTEAIESALPYANGVAEIIIVNDGTTDAETLNILEHYSNQGIKVISQPNSGLAHARNKGVNSANGEYILPLDADNRLRAGYIEKSIKLLETGPYDIVYAKPHFIGEDIQERQFNTHEFEGSSLLIYNYIDACAVYKKSVWDAIGGYDDKMPFSGQEDWEFWINAFFSGYKFKFIDEELFDYRIRKTSMITDISKERFEANNNYILLKHKKGVFDLVLSGVKYQKFHEKDHSNYLRASLKYLLKSLKRSVGIR